MLVGRLTNDDEVYEARDDGIVVLNVITNVAVLVSPSDFDEEKCLAISHVLGRGSFCVSLLHILFWRCVINRLPCGDSSTTCGTV